MTPTDGGTIESKPYRLLVEHRNRKQGGKLFHIIVKEVESELVQKHAVALARDILKIAGEKE